MSENDTRTLYVVVHNPDGGIGHQRIGQALVEADFDATLTKLALRLGCEPLASFTIYSRRQAAAAIQELEELGDVDVDPRDFDPKWFPPRNAWQQSTDYSSIGDALSQQEFASNSLSFDAFCPASSIAGTCSTLLNRILTRRSPRKRPAWPTNDEPSRRPDNMP
jgi:hypothetical protein